MFHEPWWSLVSSSYYLFSGQHFTQGSVWPPGWICLMETVPSACDLSHWQWLGWAPVAPANVKSIASISSGGHGEEKPHVYRLHYVYILFTLYLHTVYIRLLFSSYRTNVWKLLGLSGLSAYGRTASLSFCIRLEPYLHLKGPWRYHITSVKFESKTVWDLLCSNWYILCKRPNCWVV